jgi:hypothetical protein
VINEKEEARARAEARFQKQEERGREATQVHAEIAARARATDDNTARLKAQRIAKEAADAAAQRPPDGGHARKRGRKRPPKLVGNPDEVPGG